MEHQWTAHNDICALSRSEEFGEPAGRLYLNTYNGDRHRGYRVAVRDDDDLKIVASMIYKSTYSEPREDRRAARETLLPRIEERPGVRLPDWVYRQRAQNDRASK